VNVKTLDYSGSRQILDKLHIVTSYEILYLGHLSKSNVDLLSQNLLGITETHNDKISKDGARLVKIPKRPLCEVLMADIHLQISVLYPRIM
jgi:hypothetical protein